MYVLSIFKGIWYDQHSNGRLWTRFEEPVKCVWWVSDNQFRTYVTDHWPKVIFPFEMKIANVLPLNGDPMLFNDHRPSLYICRRSLKRSCTPICWIFSIYKVLISIQFAFRKSHSYMVLMIMLNEITNALKNGDYVIGIFLEFLRFSKVLFWVQSCSWHILMIYVHGASFWFQ